MRRGRFGPRDCAIATTGIGADGLILYTLRDRGATMQL